MFKYKFIESVYDLDELNGLDEYIVKNIKKETQDLYKKDKLKQIAKNNKKGVK